MMFASIKKRNLPNKISGLNRAGQVLYVMYVHINLILCIQLVLLQEQEKNVQKAEFGR